MTHTMKKELEERDEAVARQPIGSFMKGLTF
jgi:hypothetical protein